MPPKRKATAPPPAATGPAESHTRSKRVRVASAARALLEPDVEEAPEPAVEEAPAPAKRGRKTKAVVEDMATAAEVAVEVPEPVKRGRRAAAAAGESAAEGVDEAKSAAASKKTTTKSKAQPKAQAEPKTKTEPKSKAKAETKAKAEPKPKAAKAKADSKPSPAKASPKPKKATTKTSTTSPKKATTSTSSISPKKSPAKASPKKVPSPIKTTLAVPRASKRAAVSAGPVTADYEADESRPATAVLPPAKTAKTKKEVAAVATWGRPKGTAKEKAASPRKAKASSTKASSSVSVRGARARRGTVEVEEDGGEGKEDEEEDDMDAGKRRATPPRLNYGPVHKLAAWRLARDAPAAKPARKGRATAGKAAKATTSRERQRDEIAFPLDEGENEDDAAASSPNLHTLSLSALQSLVASWSADGASGTEIGSGSGSASTSLVPSGPDHFPQQIATCTSALADIVSTLSSAVLAVQSERHAADALALRYAKVALWHHERVVRLAERLERELQRVGVAAGAWKGKDKEKAGEMGELGGEKLAGAMRLVQRIRDWTDDGAMRCDEACQRGEGNCEECGRAEVLPEPEVEEDLPDYQDEDDDEEEEDVVIVVESQLGPRNIEDGDVLQAHQRDDDTDRLDPAYAYGQIAALQSAFGGSVQPAQPAAVRPASARSSLSTNGGHRPAAITTASLTYAQPSVSTAPLTSQSQLRPASMNSNSNSNTSAPAPAKSALAEVISSTSPPYSSRDVDGEVGEYGEYRVDGEVVEVGEDTADDHLYDDLFESEAPMAALSGALQSHISISPTNPAYRPGGVTYPSLTATSASYQPALPLPSTAATSASYQPAHPLHQAPAPAHTIPTFASYQPPQSLYPQQPPILLDNDDVIAAMSKQRIREVLLNAPPYDEEGRVMTPPCDGRPMEEVGHDYQGSFHGAGEYGGGVPSFSPVASPE